MPGHYGTKKKTAPKKKGVKGTSRTRKKKTKSCGCNHEK